MSRIIPPVMSEQTEWDRLLLNIYDGRFYHPYQKRFLQSQMEFIVGVANNLKVVHTRWMVAVMTMLSDCSSSFCTISIQVFCHNGDSQMLVRSHLVVAFRFSNVNTVACVARKFI